MREGGDAALLHLVEENLRFLAALRSNGRSVERGGEWEPVGDPMEVAIDALAARLGADVATDVTADPDELEIGMTFELVVDPLYVDDDGNEVVTFAFAPVGDTTEASKP